jgi:hypothetical protein
MTVRNVGLKQITENDLFQRPTLSYCASGRVEHRSSAYQLCDDWVLCNGFEQA